MRSKFTDRRVLIPVSILTMLIITFAIELYAFARVQDIWVDESTQLSGIRAGMWEMLRWLSGVDLDRFGVPGDRTPPFSHVLDWLWLRVSGPSVLGFRVFHAAFAVFGAAVLAIVTLREIGLSAAIVVLLFLILSPKLILTGVEIRAYPMFFAVTSVQIAVFVRLAADSKAVNPKLLAIFALVCLVANYTHFYGLVSTCAFFFALGIMLIRSPASLVVLGTAFAVVMIGSLGVLPFILNAVGQSPPTAETRLTISRLFGFLLRLFGDSANMISDFAFVLFFGGTLMLFSVGVVISFGRVRKGNARRFDWLFLVVIAGIVAPVVASAFVRMSNTNLLKETYNSWLFGLLGLLISIGAVTNTGIRFWDRAGRFVAVGMMLIGAASSTYILFNHASIFIHGPRQFVGDLYDRAIAPKAIVYEPGAEWIFSYFPLVFTYNNEIDQYRRDDLARGFIRIGSGATQATAQNISSVVMPYSNVVVVDVQLRSFQDLRCEGRVDLCPQFAPGLVETALTETGQWRVSNVDRGFGVFDARVTTLERVSGLAAPKAVEDK
jgi:hypothetical protein